MPLLPVVQIVLGIGLLTFGADLLVRGAAALALRLGLSPLIIGLTVVAFGTSMPELSVSVGAGLAGEGGVALGNALGSNIFNILVVLGGSAVIRPLLVDRHLVRLDVPVMIGTAVLAFLLALNGVLGRGEGILLVGLGVVYTVLLVRAGLKSNGRTEPDPSDPPEAPRRTWVNMAWLAVGLALLVVGARVLVEGSETAARALGVSELVIGLTVVAAGTSLPELATSFVAALRGERDIAVGNVVGSNVFNSLVVLGAAAVASGPEGVAIPLGALTFDMPVMLAASVACLPIFFTGWTISRWEGWVFVGYYVVYLLYLGLAHTQHGGEDMVRAALLFFAAPLTALTLTVLAVREVSGRRRDGS